jgi:hypothetical protein
MNTHAAAEIAARVSDEALRHRDMPFCFGGVSIGERREVKSQSRVICRLGARDELPYFQAIQKRIGPFLGCHGGRGGQEAGYGNNE